MPYKYTHNRTTVGDVWFRKATYAFYQAGLTRLRDLLQSWNQREAIPPYEPEVQDLSRMIDWAAPRLARLQDHDDLYINGISVGSERYLKAAAVLQVLEAEEQLAREQADLPDGVVASRRRRISEMKRLAELGVLKDIDPADVLWEVAPSPTSRTPAPRPEGTDYEWDLFVCHATEDKDRFVTSLVTALQAAGLRVWYDVFELRLGDSMRRSIERGLARSRYGMVILSPRFFEKEWPQRELDGMAALEVDGRKVILPVWLDLSVAEIRTRSPMLADRVGMSAEHGIESVVKAVLAVFRPPESTMSPSRLALA